MSLKKEASVLTTVDHEELDYEQEDVIDSATKNCREKLEIGDIDSSVKNDSPINLEKQDDVEEGEILDEDSEDYPNKKICEFFKCGRCILGDQCRYLHVTDKGLYRMLELPSATSFAPSPLSPPLRFELQLSNVQPIVNTSNHYNCEQRETLSTAWDRALEEAKKLVKKWDAKVNPVVITIDSDDECDSNKSLKKPRCYKLPEPKVIPRNSSLSGHFSRSPKRNIVENKNEEQHEVKWHDPWRRSPVRRTKLPGTSFKLRQKLSIASSSSSENSYKQFRRRKQNYLPISARRRRENVKKQRKAHQSSSSSFSPASVYRPVKNKRKTKLQSAKEEKNKIPVVENKLGNNCKSNDPIKTEFSSFATTYAENWHKTIPHRSCSRSLSSTLIYQCRNVKRRTSLKDEEKHSLAVENKLDKNLKPNESFKKSLLSIAPAYAENRQKVIARRSPSRPPGPAPINISKSDKSKRQTKSHSALQNKSIFPDVVNNIGRNLKAEEPIKGDLPLFIPTFAQNHHKAIPCRSPSSSCSPASVCYSKNEKSKSGTKLQCAKLEKTFKSNTDKTLKTKEPIERELRIFSCTSAQQCSDVRKWTPKKIRPPSPAVESCSDMSISPLSDPDLSDLFDPDKTANKLDRTRQRETSRSRISMPQKKHSSEVYGPICPRESQPVAQSTSAMPNCATEKKAVDIPKPKEQKKLNICALQADLLKFHHQRRIVVPLPTSREIGVQRTAETKASKSSKKDILNQTKKNEVLKEAPLVQRKQISRKQMLLKQLEEINAAIEKKKQNYGFQT